VVYLPAPRILAEIFQLQLFNPRRSCAPCSRAHILTVRRALTARILFCDHRVLSESLTPPLIAPPRAAPIDAHRPAALHHHRGVREIHRGFALTWRSAQSAPPPHALMLYFSHIAPKMEPGVAASLRGSSHSFTTPSESTTTLS